ncbi:MAG: hypothetical protein R3D59_01590 [Paracoccaceae bacterium]
MRPPAGDTTLTLQTLLYETGGDAWPPATLGHVTFTGAGTDIAALSTTDFTRPAVPESFREGAAPFRESPFTQAQCRSGGLRVLGEGEKRRIYFAILEDDGEERFLLGHTVIGADGSETDERGQPVTEPVLRPFDMMRTAADLCVLGGPGAKDETWQARQHLARGATTSTSTRASSRAGLRAGSACRMRFHPIRMSTKSTSPTRLLSPRASNRRSGAMIHDTIIVRGRATAADRTDRNRRRRALRGQLPATGRGFRPDHPAYVYLRDQASCAAPTPTSPRRFRMPAGWGQDPVRPAQPLFAGEIRVPLPYPGARRPRDDGGDRVLDPSQMDVMYRCGDGRHPPAPMDHAHGGDSRDSGGDAATPINDLPNGR